MKPVVLDGVAQSTRDRFLSCDIIETLWTPFAGDDLIRHKKRDEGGGMRDEWKQFFIPHPSALIPAFDVARLRTYPQHTLPLLPLLRSRPGGVHKASVVRSPKSDKLSKTRARVSITLEASSPRPFSNFRP